MASTESDPDIRNRSQQSPLASQRAKHPTAPTGNPPAVKGGYFPLGYKEGFSQWVCGTI